VGPQRSAAQRSTARGSAGQRSAAQHGKARHNTPCSCCCPLQPQASVLHEGNSKLALALGANSKPPIPFVIISVSGGGLHDVAVSPNGMYLAAACRDGAVRVISTSNGQVRAAHARCQNTCNIADVVWWLIARVGLLSSLVC